MKFDDVAFLEVEHVVRAHDYALTTGGGLDGTRDHGLLESAVMRPRATFGDVVCYPTLATMAAVYIVGIAKNHAFNDANKRTALISGLLFLEVNGFELSVGTAWDIYLEQIAEDLITLQNVAGLVASLLPDGDIQIDL